MEDKKTLVIEDFVTLLLATLASNPKIIDLKDKDKRIVLLPSDYKQRIENILCAENRWKEMFSILIDTEEYFYNHFAWESELALAFGKVLKELKKEIKYDFLRDSLLISFNQDEIDILMEKYQDEHLKNTMDHFVCLLTNYIYTREYQEHIHDYSALAVQKMRKLNVEEFKDGFEDEFEDEYDENMLNIFNRQNNKRLKLFRKK